MLPGEPEEARVTAYERGLPEAFRVKCAEKQHTTLQAATESTLALWNAKLAAGTVSASRGAAQLHHTHEDDSWRRAIRRRRARTAAALRQQHHSEPAGARGAWQQLYTMLTQLKARMAHAEGW